MALKLQMSGAPVLERGEGKLLFKYRGKFALVTVSHLFGNPGNRQSGICEQPGGLFHPYFPQVNGEILPEDSTKIIFQTGFADGETGGEFPCRVMLAKIRCDDLFYPLGDVYLSFRKEGADLWLWNFLQVQQERKQGK